MSERWGPLAWVLLFLFATGLLAIGLTRDWRLLHEDNGALHTTFALSHLEIGLAATRGHDLFYDPRTDEGRRYGHHPPATGLLVAAAFALTGSDAPWVARATAIAFQLASLGLFVALLGIHLPARLSFLGGVIFAVLPMGAYFGRVVNYEAFCLTGVLLQLYGYARLKALGSRSGLGLLALGILASGFVDWPGFFFAAALGLTEALAALRGDRSAARTFGFIAAVALAGFAANLAHLVLAAGSLDPLIEVFPSDHEQPATLGLFLHKELDFGRSYFGRAALVAGVLTAAALLVERSPVTSSLRSAAHPEVLSRWLGASGLAALAYTCAAPSWAIVHAYWHFYYLPFLATALVLLVAALLERLREAEARRWIYGALLVVIAVDVGLTSYRTLRKRHSTPEAYAIRQTQIFRESFLAPRSDGVRARSPRHTLSAGGGEELARAVIRGVPSCRSGSRPSPGGSPPRCS